MSEAKTCHCRRWTWEPSSRTWHSQRNTWLPLDDEAYMVCDRCQTRLNGDGTAEREKS